LRLEWNDCQMTQNSPATPARRSASALPIFLGTYVVTAVPLVALFGLRGVTLFISFVVAVVAGGYAWLHAEGMPRHLAAYTLSGAALFGGIGFAAGYFLPLLLAGGANQGPLLGIFITGPAGILIGAIAGLVYARGRSGRE